MQPIRLSDDELTQVFRCAQPLPVADRDAFLQAVADKLAAYPEIGPGLVHRCCREAQKELLRGNYPDFANGGGGGSWSKYR